MNQQSKKIARTAEIKKPTEQLMSEGMQFAYDFFNEKFFSSELPQCMITVACNRKSTLGYFEPYGYVSQNGDLIHQIAMNSHYLRVQSIKQSLSTLLHEQLHLMVFELLGRKKADGYHCKKWAAQMEALGLIPSHNGKAGGRKTGYRMTHYIE